MQMEEAQQLRKEWLETGNVACDHPFMVKEYYLGSATGDAVCTTCGESFCLGDGPHVIVSDSWSVNYRDVIFPPQTKGE